MSAAEEPLKPNRAANWAVNVLLGAAIVLCALVIVPALLGYHRYVIDGHSMETALPYGSVAYEKEVPVEDLQVGDIITFQPPAEYASDRPVTHRIIEISKTDDGRRSFRTKGDNNESPDPWTFTLDEPTQPRMAFHLPYVGYIYIALSIWWIRFLLIALPAVAIAVWIVVALWREAGREVERGKRAAADGEVAA